MLQDKRAPENGAEAAAAAAEKKKAEEEAWRTADPYAFLPKPQENNMVGALGACRV